MRFAASLIVSGVLVASLGSQAAGQGKVEAWTFGADSECGDHSPSGTSYSFTCTLHPGITGTAAASADHGVVGIYARTAARGAASDGFNGGTQAMATWKDQLHWTSTGGAPSTILFDLMLTGSVSTSVSGGPGGHLSGAFTHPSAFFSAYTSARTAATGWDPGSTGVSAGDDPLSVSYAVPLSLSLDVSGMSSAFFMIYLNTPTSVVTGNIPGDTFSGSSRSDFSHTAKLADLSFLDASGHDLGSEVSYTFDFGTQVGDRLPSTTTPEPASIALLVSGLAGLGMVRRRHRAVRR